MEMILIGLGIIIALTGLYMFVKSFNFTFAEDPYAFAIGKKKVDVIILSPTVPNKIERITKGKFGNKGLYLENEKRLLKNILIEQTPFILLHLPDGSYVPTQLTEIPEKKNKQIGFLVAEFNRYHQLLNINIDRVIHEYREKELTIGKSLIEEIKKNAGIIGIIGGIMILNIASIMVNVAQAGDLIKPSQELYASLTTCQNTLQTCINTCQKGTSFYQNETTPPTTPNIPLYNEIIGGG